MKIASLSEIKKELNRLTNLELLGILLDLAKFSADNKKYLFFKLYERDNPGIFLEMVQEELAEAFHNANTNNYYYTKKSAQSIRKTLNKYLKLTKDKTQQIDLIVYFCELMLEFNFLNFGHPVIENIYYAQLGKIDKLVAGLHEDLQFDYQEKIVELREKVSEVR
ncbi:MAG: hypothetical protein ACFCUU_07880 [Cyclobacteriaceae bacterium]